MVSYTLLSLSMIGIFYVQEPLLDMALLIVVGFCIGTGTSVTFRIIQMAFYVKQEFMGRLFLSSWSVISIIVVYWIDTK